jgi:tetratricopeptide (TPR) repeat protein
MEAFAPLLSPVSTKNTFYVQGDGGIGKTWLLQRLMEEYRGSSDLRIPGELIDFYDTKNRRVSGLMRTIVQQLGEQHFTAYKVAEREFEDARAHGLSGDALDALQRRKERQFVSDCRSVAKDKRPVLFLDTFELVQKESVESWLLNTLTPQLREFTFAIASRQSLDTPPDHVEMVKLKGLDLGEVKEYFRRKGVTEIEASEELVAKILARTEGQPILIDLVIDWWQNQVFASLFDIENLPKERIEEALVSGIRDLREPLYQVILYIAHLHRRFNRELLGRLIDNGFVSARRSDIEEIVSKLSQFSFVKIREHPESCLLHDEMRDMVVHHVWESLDWAGDMRREASKVAIDYYAEKMEVADEVEKQDLIAEQLYYILHYDPAKGLETFKQRFDPALKRHQLGFCGLLLGEVEKYRELFSLMANCEVGLRRGQWLLESKDFVGAETTIRSLLEGYETEDILKVDLLLTLGNAVIRQGRRAESVHYFGEAEHTCERKHIEQRLAWAANALGWANERLGRWDQALYYHNKSVEYSTIAGDEEQMATSLNESGYIHARLGEYEVAEEKCLLGLRRREALFGSMSREVGFSHSTLGEVYRYRRDYRSAFECYERALAIFEEPGREDVEWISVVLQERGVANLAVAQKYKRLGNTEEGERCLRAAYEDLSRSIHLCETHDLTMRKSGAYHRMAHILVERGETEEAVRMFWESFELRREAQAFHGAIDSLVELAEIELLRKSWRAAEEHINMIHELEGAEEHAARAEGIESILRGDIAFGRTQAVGALKLYCEGYPKIAETGSHWFQMLSDKIESLKVRLEQLDYETRLEWCKRLKECWDQPGIPEARRRMMLETLETQRLMAQLDKARRARAEQREE